MFEIIEHVICTVTIFLVMHSDGLQRLSLKPFGRDNAVIDYAALGVHKTMTQNKRV